MAQATFYNSAQLDGFRTPKVKEIASRNHISTQAVANWLVTEAKKYEPVNKYIVRADRVEYWVNPITGIRQQRYKINGVKNFLALGEIILKHNALTTLSGARITGPRGDSVVKAKQLQKWRDNLADRIFLSEWYSGFPVRPRSALELENEGHAYFNGVFAELLRMMEHLAKERS